LKDLARTIRNQQLRISRLEYKRKIETQHEKCEDSEMAQAVVRAFNEADAHIHEVLDKESKKNKAPVMLWELHLEHMRKVSDKDGNMYGIRFHPELLNYALMIIAKTSQSVYKELREEFKLPDLSYVSSYIRSK
jgi:hypothetical protein